jgi:hypothetical protein
LVFPTLGTGIVAGLYTALVFLWALFNPTGGSGDAMVFALPFFLFPVALLSSFPPLLVAGLASAVTRALPAPRVVAATTTAAVAGLVGASELVWDRANNESSAELITPFQIGLLVAAAFWLGWRSRKLDNSVP